MIPQSSLQMLYILPCKCERWVSLSDASRFARTKFTSAQSTPDVSGYESREKWIVAEDYWMGESDDESRLPRVALLESTSSILVRSENAYRYTFREKINSWRVRCNHNSTKLSEEGTVNGYETLRGLRTTRYIRTAPSWYPIRPRKLHYIWWHANCIISSP